MEATFNMGVGMFAVVSAEDADRALAFLAGRGVEAWQVGEVIEGTGKVQMVGSAHPRLIGSDCADQYEHRDQVLHPSRVPSPPSLEAQARGSMGVVWRAVHGMRGIATSRRTS